MNTFVIVFLILCSVVLFAWLLILHFEGPKNTVSPSYSAPSPKIIVNIPSDFKPIQPLPGDSSIEGQKAVLWYSVFKLAVEEMAGSYCASYSEVESAKEAADAAVEACFGK